MPCLPPSFRTSSTALLACALLTACPGPGPEPEPEASWEIAYAGDESFGALLSVWGPSADDLYAVGGNPDLGGMLHWDGSEWSEQALPESLALTNWVFGVDDVLWVAANGGQVARRDASGEWSTMQLESTEDLWGIWASGPDDVYTVGGTPVLGEGPVLAHFDGSAWTELEIPPLDRESDSMFKVWGTGPDDVFVVGRKGIVLHYDGSSWEQQLAGTTSDLISLWGTGPDEIVAVGGRSNGVIARYDGSSWTSETLSSPGLNGVWVDSSGTAFAVGNEGLAIEIEAGSFDYVELDRSTRPDVLHGAFGFEDGSRIGVGGNLLLAPSGPWTGVILQYMQP